MLRVPGSEQRPVPRQERRRRRARRLLAARRAQAGAGEPRPAGGVLRHRLRDHRAGQRDDGLPGASGWASPTSRCSSRTCWCRRRSRRSWSRPTCRVQAFLAAGPRVQRDGHRASTRRSPSGTACRSWSPASSRWTSWRASGARSCSSRRAGTRSRTPTRARCRRGQPGRRGDAARRLRGDRPHLARHRRDPGERLAAVASGTRDFDAEQRFDGRPTSTPRSRRCAAPARCSRA